jgi:hypothetical protein
MRVVCAWCGAALGQRACEPEKDGEVTHGICPTCKARQLGDVTQESFAPVGAGSCAVSSATAGRDRRIFDVGGHGAPAESGRNKVAVESTPLAGAAGVEYIAVSHLANICGVSDYHLHNRYRPDHWGVPREWVFRGRATLYSLAALPELADSLEVNGLHEAASNLRVWWLDRTVRRPVVPPWYKRGAME